MNLECGTFYKTTGLNSILVTGETEEIGPTAKMQCVSCDRDLYQKKSRSLKGILRAIGKEEFLN